jgi:hypothetical protein
MMARRREPERTLVAVSVFLALCLAGCGREEAPPVEWRSSKDLPENFPSDIPIYPSAKVVKAVKGNGAVVVWDTPDALSVVEQYYTRELTEKGWGVTKYPGLPTAWMGEEGVTVIATRWGRQLSFALGEKGEHTAITVILPDWEPPSATQPPGSP